MSWLTNIVESIMNEISADDAYRRFYNSIPREDYDRILDGDPAPDKFMQFILNCVRDGMDDAADAMKAVKQYKSLSPEIKQRVQMGVKNGEYDSILDMIGQMTYFEQGGGIVSKKQFAKNGYIRLKETDDWIVTCTTNYMANNHYFGDSHWCTASDRAGEYDGYEMFLRYSIHDDDVLLQFRSKKKVLPPFYGSSKSPQSILVDYPMEDEASENAIRFNYQLFQISVDKNGETDEICDYLDSRVRFDEFAKIIGGEALSILKDRSTIEKLFEIQDRQSKDEQKYQAVQENLARQKKERKKARLRIKYNEKDEERKKKQNEADKEALSKWEKFINEKIYETPEFLTRAIEADDNYREDVEGYDFVRIGTVRECSNIGLLGIWPCASVNYSVEEVEDEHGEVVDYTVEGYKQQYVLWTYGMMNVIFDIETKVPLKSCRTGVGDMATMQKVPLMITEYKPYDEQGGFAQVSNFGEEQFFIRLSDRKFYATNKDIEGCNFCSKIGDEFYVFGDHYSDGLRAYINCKTDELVSLIDCPFLESPFFYAGSNGFIINNRNNTYKIIPCDAEGEQQTPIEVSLPPKINGLEGKYALVNFVNTRLGVIRLVCNDDETRAYNYISKNNSGELIFGVWGESYSDGREDSEKGLYIAIGGRFHDTYKERLAYYLKSKTYWLFTAKEGEKPCDKYAFTEKDRAAMKNFADWQAKGGHTPEERAQMDKMWDDYYGEKSSYGGQKALDAWNDADRGLDARADNHMKYDKNLGLNAAMQKFDDDDRWRGYIGIKDPEGYSKDMTNAITTMSGEENGLHRLVNGEIPDCVRKNPWYRIGRDGKPLDQTWYDEDEIPANLSDRVVRENKINEEFNNLQSIMRRMGLLD